MRRSRVSDGVRTRDNWSHNPYGNLRNQQLTLNASSPSPAKNRPSTGVTVPGPKREGREAGVPLLWRMGDRCYVPRRGIGLVSRVTEAGVSVLFDSGRAAILPHTQLRLVSESPEKRDAEGEASVLKKVKHALETCGGVYVMRNNVGAGKRKGFYVKYGLDVGSADLVAIVAPYGRWLCVETKRPKGNEATEAQEKWLRKMRGYGAVVGVCRTAEEALRLVQIARVAETCW